MAEDLTESQNPSEMLPMGFSGNEITHNTGELALTCVAPDVCSPFAWIDSALTSRSNSPQTSRHATFHHFVSSMLTARGEQCMQVADTPAAGVSSHAAGAQQWLSQSQSVPELRFRQTAAEFRQLQRLLRAPRARTDSMIVPLQSAGSYGILSMEMLLASSLLVDGTVRGCTEVLGASQGLDDQCEFAIMIQPWDAEFYLICLIY